MILPIPGARAFEIPGVNGHDVVYGLAAGRGSEVYVSVSNEFTPGVCAFIAAFDGRAGTFRKVIDLAGATAYDPRGGRMPHSKVHLCLNSTPGGRVFAATHFTAPAIGQTSFDPIEAYRGGYEGSHLVEYDPAADRVTSYGCLLPGEGARISAIDPVRECLYLLSYPRNHLFQFHYPGRTLRDLGRLGQENPFGMEVDARGDVYTTDDFGRIVRYSHARGRLEELDVFLPLKAGRRRSGNYARRSTLGLDGCIYGVGNKGCRLFRFNPTTEELTDFGVILGHEAAVNYEYPRLPPVKALVQTDPRTLYIAFGGDGIYTGELQVPSLVRFDLEERKAVEIGCFASADAVAWIPQCALYVPRDRALYFGMQHAAGAVCLWQVRLDETAGSAPAPLALAAHQEKVTRVPFGASVEGTNRTAFVNNGRLSMTELGWYGEGLVIPPGESAIADLVFKANTVYGVTTGRRSHLFRYAPYEQNRFLENSDAHVADLGVLCDVPVTNARILEKFLIAVETETDIRLVRYASEREALHHRPHYHSLPHWPPFWAGSEPFQPLRCIPRAAGSLSDMHLRSGGLYSRNGDGDIVRLDFESGECRAVACPRIAAHTSAAAGPESLFAVTLEGTAILFGGEERAGESVKKGLKYACKPASRAGLVALGTRDGEVIIWDSEKLAVIAAVQAPRARPVRALAFGADGCLYGFRGGDDEIGEAFIAAPPRWSVAAIGILQAPSVPRYWICHRCDCACAGAEGEVYFGETDRISHLIAYREPATNCRRYV